MIILTYLKTGKRPFYYGQRGLLHVKISAKGKAKITPAYPRNVEKCRMGVECRWGFYRFPRSSCSRSMASNRALKLPLPKLLAPLRWMISKNSVGLSSTGLVNIWSR